MLKTFLTVPAIIPLLIPVTVSNIESSTPTKIVADASLNFTDNTEIEYNIKTEIAGNNYIYSEECP